MPAAGGSGRPDDIAAPFVVNFASIVTNNRDAREEADYEERLPITRGEKLPAPSFGDAIRRGPRDVWRWAAGKFDAGRLLAKGLARRSVEWQKDVYFTRELLLRNYSWWNIWWRKGLIELRYLPARAVNAISYVARDLLWDLEVSYRKRSLTRQWALEASSRQANISDDYRRGKYRVDSLSGEDSKVPKFIARAVAGIYEAVTVGRDITANKETLMLGVNLAGIAVLRWLPALVKFLLYGVWRSGYFKLKDWLKSRRDAKPLEPKPQDVFRSRMPKFIAGERDRAEGTALQSAAKSELLSNIINLAERLTGQRLSKEEKDKVTSDIEASIKNPDLFVEPSFYSTKYAGSPTIAAAMLIFSMSRPGHEDKRGIRDTAGYELGRLLFNLAEELENMNTPFMKERAGELRAMAYNYAALAYAADEDNADARALMGIILFASGDEADKKEARKVLEAAIKKGIRGNVLRSDAELILGKILESEKDYRAAARHYGRSGVNKKRLLGEDISVAERQKACWEGESAAPAKKGAEEGEKSFLDTMKGYIMPEKFDLMTLGRIGLVLAASLSGSWTLMISVSAISLLAPHVYKYVTTPFTLRRLTANERKALGERPSSVPAMIDLVSKYDSLKTLSPTRAERRTQAIIKGAVKSARQDGFSVKDMIELVRFLGKRGDAARRDEVLNILLYRHGNEKEVLLFCAELALGKDVPSPVRMPGDPEGPADIAIKRVDDSKETSAAARLLKARALLKKYEASKSEKDRTGYLEEIKELKTMKGSMSATELDEFLSLEVALGTGDADELRSKYKETEDAQTLDKLPERPAPAAPAEDKEAAAVKRDDGPRKDWLEAKLKKEKTLTDDERLELAAIYLGMEGMSGQALSQLRKISDAGDSAQALKLRAAALINIIESPKRWQSPILSGILLRLTARHLAGLKGDAGSIALGRWIRAAFLLRDPKAASGAFTDIKSMYKEKPATPFEDLDNKIIENGLKNLLEARPILWPSSRRVNTALNVSNILVQVP